VLRARSPPSSSIKSPAPKPSLPFLPHPPLPPPPPPLPPLATTDSPPPMSSASIPHGYGFPSSSSTDLRPHPLLSLSVQAPTARSSRRRHCSPLKPPLRRRSPLLGVHSELTTAWTAQHACPLAELLLAVAGPAPAGAARSPRRMLAAPCCGSRPAAALTQPGSAPHGARWSAAQVGPGRQICCCVWCFILL
jgi:hypothetical protein